MKVLCIIPARMASSRYPGKPLAQLLGLPLVLHVWERCRLSEKVDRAVIATCDEEIKAAAEKRGAEVVMTADTHPGCVDRTEEAIDKIAQNLADDDLVLMVQGDEVLVTPAMMDAVISMYEETRAPVVNLASVIADVRDHDDPNVVKVAVAPDGRALFFSRSPIPSRVRAARPPMFQQTGVIGFSKAFLKTFSRLPRTPLEECEGIDMLRTLEHGYEIRVVTTDQPTLGVDTPGERDRAEALLVADSITNKYIRP